MGPETKPAPENCKSCSSKCAYDCAQRSVHNTAQNSSDNLPSYLQTIIQYVTKKFFQWKGSIFIATKKFEDACRSAAWVYEWWHHGWRCAARYVNSPLHISAAITLKSLTALLWTTRKDDTWQRALCGRFCNEKVPEHSPCWEVVHGWKASL